MLRPGIFRVKVAGAHARTRGEDPHETDGTQRFQPVGVLERFTQSFVGHGPAAKAVIANRRLNPGDRLRGKTSLLQNRAGGRSREFGCLRAIRMVFGHVYVIVEEGGGYALARIGFFAGKTHRKERYAQEVREIVCGISVLGFTGRL